MSKTITISDESYDFIKAMAHELETQDKRGTSVPVYRIYEKIKVEKRDGCGEHLARLDYEGAEEHYCQTCTDIIDDNDGEIDKLPEIGEDGCGCEYLDDAHWTYDIELLPAEGIYDGVAFLTEKAAQKYLKENSYHFNHGVVYVESAFRNGEIIDLVDVIKEIGKL